MHKLTTNLLLAGITLLGNDNHQAAAECALNVGFYCNHTVPAHDNFAAYEDYVKFSADTIGPDIYSSDTWKPNCRSFSDSGWHGGTAIYSSWLKVRGWATAPYPDANGKMHTDLHICDYQILSTDWADWACYCDNLPHNY